MLSRILWTRSRFSYKNVQQVIGREIDVVQIYLPAPDAKITDPSLALILAAILGLSERLHHSASELSA